MPRYSGLRVRFILHWTRIWIQHSSILKRIEIFAHTISFFLAAFLANEVLAWRFGTVQDLNPYTFSVHPGSLSCQQSSCFISQFRSDNDLPGIPKKQTDDYITSLYFPIYRWDSQLFDQSYDSHKTGHVLFIVSRENAMQNQGARGKNLVDLFKTRWMQNSTEPFEILRFEENKTVLSPLGIYYAI